MIDLKEATLRSFLPGFIDEGLSGTETAVSS
jgi:hypothetical protein